MKKKPGFLEKPGFSNIPQMNLPLLLRALADYKITNERDVEITSITSDSRNVTPGSLFVAYPGLNVDGTRFVPEAIQHGAVAIVTESPISNLQSPIIQVPNARSALAHLSAAWHDFPSRKLRVIEIGRAHV